MIDINLLPTVQRPSKWQINKVLLTAGIIVMLGGCSMYSYNAFTIWSVEKKLQDTRNAYELLHPTLQIMRTVSNKQQALNMKNDILAVLTKERNSWYFIIQHLTTVMPRSIWITAISESSNEGVIQIIGEAASYPVVAEFVQRLEQDTFFCEPVLVRDESEPDLPNIKFEITVKYKGM